MSTTLDKYVQAHLDAENARRLEEDKRRLDRLASFWAECKNAIPEDLWPELNTGGLDTIVEIGSDELRLPVTIEGTVGYIYMTDGPQHDFALQFGEDYPIVYRNLYRYTSPEEWGRLIVALREYKKGEIPF